MSEAVNEYIHERLFNDSEVILYTDIMSKFNFPNGQAKKAMYKYYQTTKSKVNCVIVCCYSDGKIRVIQDLSKFEASDDIVDAFIYAFCPMEQFTVVNKICKRPMAVRNGFECAQSEEREQAKEELPEPRVRAPVKLEEAATAPAAAVDVRSKPQSKPKPKPQSKTPARAKTHPQVTPKQKDQGKDMGLQSTRLLQKMRQEREEREQERLQELRKRREKQNETVAADPKRKKEMEELSKMFEGDSDTEAVPQVASSPDDEQHALHVEESPETKPVEPKALNNKELGELLDTTAEESLIELPAAETVKSQEASSYVDDEGYIVTQRPNQRASSTPVKRKIERPSPQQDKTEQPKKKVQKSLMSFFGKKK